MIQISEDCLQRLRHLILAKKPNETGGILVGIRYPSLYLIKSAVDSGPKSIERRYRFKKDFEYTQKELNRLNIESGGTWGYLGEWHSHPDCSLAPSPIDRRIIKDISKSPEMIKLKPLLLIGDVQRDKLCCRFFCVTEGDQIIDIPQPN